MAQHRNRQVKLLWQNVNRFDSSTCTSTTHREHFIHGMAEQSTQTSMQVVVVTAAVAVMACTVSHRMALNEICLPHQFSINYILWPLVELNLSPISLSFSTLFRDHTALFLLSHFCSPAEYLVSFPYPRDWICNMEVETLSFSTGRALYSHRMKKKVVISLWFILKLKYEQFE